MDKNFRKITGGLVIAGIAAASVSAVDPEAVAMTNDMGGWAQNILMTGTATDTTPPDTRYIANTITGETYPVVRSDRFRRAANSSKETMYTYPAKKAS